MVLCVFILLGFITFFCFRAWRIQKNNQAKVNLLGHPPKPKVKFIPLNDEDFPEHGEFNPATGLLMIGMFDTAGNAYGTGTPSPDLIHEQED